MAKSKRQPPHQPAQVDSSEAEEDGDEVYVVEAIKASRWDELKGHWRYLIKWKGYDIEDMTWEPAENLNCPDLLAQHEAERERKEAAKASGSGASTPRASTSTAKPLPLPKPISKPVSKPVKKPAAKTIAKGKARASQAAAESSEAEEATIAQLDERRAEAKKKAAKAGRTSTARAEDLVASKWEKKGESKKSKDASPSKPISKGMGTPVSIGKNKWDSSNDAASAGRSTMNSKATSSEIASVPVAKASKAKKVATPENESASDDDRPLKRPKIVKSTSMPSSLSATAAASGSSTSKPASTSNGRPASPPPRSASTQPTVVPVKPVTASTNPIRAMQFKRKPPAAPPASIPPPTSNGAAPAVRETSVVPVQASPTVDPRQRRASSQRPSVRFTENSAATTSTAPIDEAPEPSPEATSNGPTEQELEAIRAQEAETQAKKAKESEENRKQMLASLEGRLTRSEYYQRTAVFHNMSLAAACAEAVHVSHGTALRMKGRGVAIICDSRDAMVSGEGVALGLLLMLIGAKMPGALAEVAVVCVHRRETLAPIERMYNELVNMPDHHVEFLHFGNDQEMAPILMSGFLIVLSLSAMQQGMAVESFCLSSFESNVRNCTVLAHPASIVLARTRLPQWQKIVHTLANSSIPVVEKQELKLELEFIAVDKSAYLSTSPNPPNLPPVTTESELAEITSLLCWKREQEPAKWRRFIIVVDQVNAAEAEKAKDRGIELCTWIGLTEMTKNCIF